MKEIREEADLWNVVDSGEIAAGRKASVRVSLKVDNGSMEVVIPESLANQLALPRLPKKRRVRFADGRTAEKEVAEGLRLRLPRLDREWLGFAVVEPGRDTVFLSCEAMENMDIIADHREGCLKVRPGTENGQISIIE